MYDYKQRPPSEEWENNYDIAFGKVCTCENPDVRGRIGGNIEDECVCATCKKPVRYK